jgi:hypothetical protein
MKPAQALHEAGQSLWLDYFTRALRVSGIDGSACRSLTLDDDLAPFRFDDDLMTDDQGPDR